jgi:hypothetical protein
MSDVSDKTGGSASGDAEALQQRQAEGTEEKDETAGYK